MSEPNGDILLNPSALPQIDTSNEQPLEAPILDATDVPTAGIPDVLEDLSDENSGDLPLPMVRGEVVDVKREIFTQSNLRNTASLNPKDDEIAIRVYDRSTRIMRGEPGEVQRMPGIEEKPLFKIHSHNGLGHNQPSILDLHSAEVDQLYDDNPHVRFFIITVEGITEYRLPPTLVARLLENDEEFREYYSAWLKERYGEDKPDGKTISTQFNSEHMTFNFYPWESDESSQIVEAFRSQKGPQDVSPRSRASDN